MAQINIKLSQLNAFIESNGAQAAAINSAGGVTVWQQVPGEWKGTSGVRHFAFHPLVFVAENWYFQNGSFQPPTGAQTRTRGGYTAYNAINIVQAVGLTIYDESDAVVATLSADTIGGKAELDISAYVQTMFSDVMQDYDLGNYYDPDKLLSVIVKTKLFSTTGEEYVVQNAVSQMGSDGEKNFTANVFGQDNKRVVVWSSDDDTYPTISVLVKTNTSYDGMMYMAGHTYNLRVGGDAVFEAIDAAFGVVAAGFTYEEDESLERCGANALRWLNRKGAIEYHVFKRGMSKTKTASTKAVRQVFGTDYSEMRGNRRATEVEGKRTITLRDAGLTYDELDYLTKMPYSPRIQWFDPDNDMWVDVLVETFTHEEVNKLLHVRTSADLTSSHNLYEFEITLECPAINMQF